KEYEANRLTVVRQLRYSSADPLKALDLALFLNGVPVATAELKNQGSGSNVHHAMRQYRKSRDAKELIFARRTLAHFAVDQDLVFVTTRLAGDDTRFLPFNTGSRGPGQYGGAGNPLLPPDATGYRTSYLWEQVWQPDAWLDLIQRFLHVEDEGLKKGKAPVAKRGDAHPVPGRVLSQRPHDVPLVVTGEDQRLAVGVAPLGDRRLALLVALVLDVQEALD
ncbi:type I restriction endonuclease, partial [Micromonospora harpali]